MKLASLYVQRPHLIDILRAVFLGIYGLVSAMDILRRIVQISHRFQAITISLIIRFRPLAEGQGTVGIKQIRMVIVNDLFHHLQPIFVEFPVLGQPDPRIGFPRPCHMLIIVMIKIPVSRVIAVIGNACIRAVAVGPLVVFPPPERGSQVLRQAKGHMIFFAGCLPQPADILLRPHIHGIKPIVLGLEIEEMIMVGSLGHKEPGARPVIFLHQALRVKMFRLPQRADVLIAELGRMAVSPQMVFILFRPLYVHISCVPIPAHGYGLGTPVAPDPELYVPEPLRAPELCQ